MSPLTHLAVGLAAFLAARPVTLVLPAQEPLTVPAEPDRWVGEDKFRHLAMSFATTSFVFAAARSLGAAETAPTAGAAAGLLAGLGKELYDVRAGGTFSLRDLAWDAAGVLAGYALAHNVR